jgi:hypothetical protein
MNVKLHKAEELEEASLNDLPLSIHQIYGS